MNLDLYYETKTKNVNSLKEKEEALKEKTKKEGLVNLNDIQLHIEEFKDPSSQQNLIKTFQKSATLEVPQICTQ